MFKDLTLDKFMEETSKSTPVPGGGSIAALTGAAGASLVCMVAHLTLGKKKYEDVKEIMEDVVKKSESLKENLLVYIDKDSNAFNKVMAAFKLPKETDEEKKERTLAISNASIEAAYAPLSIAEESFKILDLAEIVIEKGNKSAITDGMVATMNARTAVLSALLNVEINLSSIKDEKVVSDLKGKVIELREKVKKREEEILSKVEL